MQNNFFTLRTLLYQHMYTAGITHIAVSRASASKRVCLSHVSGHSASYRGRYHSGNGTICRTSFCSPFPRISETCPNGNVPVTMNQDRKGRVRLSTMHEQHAQDF